MLISLTKGQKGSPSQGLQFAITCPKCHTLGMFLPLGQDLSAFTDLRSKTIQFGNRKCPNEDCNCHIFVVASGQSVIETFPPELKHFDSRNVPVIISDSFTEALICRANNCFVAAAIMIRKTFEVLCDDQSATGQHLFDRIESLKTKVTLPQSLLNGLQDMRLLGNDAAHPESRVFYSVGAAEIDVAIDFTITFINSLYKLHELTERLASFKRRD